MNIDQIRIALADKISSHSEWHDVLEQSEPGHYGIIDSEVNITKDNIWVDIPNRTFTFKEVDFNFKLQMMSSNDGIEDDFSRITGGSGMFQMNGNNVVIEEMKIEIDLDLYAEEA